MGLKNAPAKRKTVKGTGSAVNVFNITKLINANRTAKER